MPSIPTDANDILKALMDGPITDELLIAYFRSQAAGFNRKRKAYDHFRSVPMVALTGISEMFDRQGRPLPLIENMFGEKVGDRAIVNRKTIDAIVGFLNEGAPASIS